MLPRTLEVIESHTFRAHNESATIAYVVLLLWFLIAAAASWFGWVQNVPSATLFIAGSVVSTAGFFSGYFGSVRFRRFILAQNLRHVTLVQTSRATGLIFFFEAGRKLPGVFAIPTGCTDVTVGITAPFAAFALISQYGLPKRGLAVWHVLGALAAVTSGTLGILTSPTWLGLLAGDLTSQAMSEWPLSLVPLFLGPVTLIFHLIALCIIQSSPSWQDTCK